MSLFKKYFEKILQEDNVAGSGGAFGDTSSTGGMFPGGSDSYAPGDARIPTFLGNKSKKRRKKRKKRRGKKTKKESIVMQRRNMKSSM